MPWLQSLKKTLKTVSLFPEVIFTINATIEYQEIVGFGGAITDSAGLNINYLPKAAQEKLIE